MSLRRSDLRISVTDYIEGEKDGRIRHEYVGGHVYAMAGASDRHNRIALNVASRLNEHLSDGPCETFISDMKVRVDEHIYYYPDVMVSCDSAGSAYYRSQPVLIVEVTSPATERVDRHEKMLAYRNIGSLREYVLVSQDQMRVELHRKKGDGWDQHFLTRPGDVWNVESAGLSISLSEVYRNIKLD